MISAISDLHTDWPDRIEPMMDLTRGPKEGTLIIAGDIGDLDYLTMFDGFAPKIAVLGNHDIWTKEGSSQEKADSVADKLRQHGFFVLDKEPFIDGKIAYVGNIGWYDYSFFKKEYFPELNGWSQEKIHEHLWKNKYMVWNDAQFAKWGKTDIEKTDELADKLDRDLASVNDQVETIVVVMHHLPFESLVIRIPESKTWECRGAYMGSKKFGEVIQKYEKVELVIAGHQHRNRKIKEKKIDCYTVALNPRSPKFLRLPKYTSLEALGTHIIPG